MCGRGCCQCPCGEGVAVLIVFMLGGVPCISAGVDVRGEDVGEQNSSRLFCNGRLCLYIYIYIYIYIYVYV